MLNHVSMIFGDAAVLLFCFILRIVELTKGLNNRIMYV